MIMDEVYNKSYRHTSQMISDEERNIILIANLAILCSIISLLGSIANVINMVVFYRQGLDTTTNISFFSLAVSDLFSMIFQLFFNVFVNPLFVNLGFPIVHTDVQFLTTGVPREVFAQITCMLTSFLTAERCLCVVFPLHVKQIITPRISVSCILVIYSSTLLMGAPLYFTSYYTWQFFPDSNASLLALAFTSQHDVAEAVSFFAHALSTVLSFMSVLIFTLILIYNLRQKNEWRQTANTDDEKAKRMLKRDRATIHMVVLIAGILIVCYTPAVALSLTIFLVPEFSVVGIHYNLYHSLWSLAMLLEAVNSSVNIFLYYRMSSKYRRTCNEIISSFFRLDRHSTSNNVID